VITRVSPRQQDLDGLDDEVDDEQRRHDPHERVRPADLPQRDLDDDKGEEARADTGGVTRQGELICYLVGTGRRRRQAEIQPVDVDGIKAVSVGLILWSIAFVVLAFYKDRLDARGQGWWLWTCLAGIGLGLLGLTYCRRRRDAIAAAHEREDDHEDAPR